jgi:hypothetical protein
MKDITVETMLAQFTLDNAQPLENLLARRLRDVQYLAGDTWKTAAWGDGYTASEWLFDLVPPGSIEDLPF